MKRNLAQHNESTTQHNQLMAQRNQAIPQHNQTDTTQSTRRAMQSTHDVTQPTCNVTQPTINETIAPNYTKPTVKSVSKVLWNNRKILQKVAWSRHPCSGTMGMQSSNLSNQYGKGAVFGQSSRTTPYFSNMKGEWFHAE